MTTWTVYKFTRGQPFERVGEVEADHQPAAWLKAAKLWPELAKQRFPTYQNGRLALRAKADDE